MAFKTPWGKLALFDYKVNYKKGSLKKYKHFKQFLQMDSTKSNNLKMNRMSDDMINWKSCTSVYRGSSAENCTESIVFRTFFFWQFSSTRVYIYILKKKLPNTWGWNGKRWSVGGWNFISHRWTSAQAFWAALKIHWLSIHTFTTLH